MTDLPALVDALGAAGPWGIVAILLVVLRDRDKLVQELQKARVEDADKRVEDEQARGAFARELLERTIGVLRDVVETARRGKP